MRRGDPLALFPVAGETPFAPPPGSNRSRAQRQSSHESRMTSPAYCQGCGAKLTLSWIDLGLSPLANSNVPPERAGERDPVYPLQAFVCGECLLVQVPSVVPADAIFNDHYAYFSSYSESWLAHARRYVEDMAERFSLGPAGTPVGRENVFAQLYGVDDQSKCAGMDSVWYFSPDKRQVILCPTMCDTLKQKGGSVQVELGCPTRVRDRSRQEM